MVSILPRFGAWANGIRDFETPYGKLGLRQLAILWLIRHGHVPAEEMSPTALATHFDVQPSVITRALAKLEAGGFVERTVDVRDSRRFLITLTDKGRSVSEFVEQLFVSDVADSIAELRDEQIAELSRTVAVLDAVTDDLERKRRQTLRPPRRPRRPQPD